MSVKKKLALIIPFCCSLFVFSQNDYNIEQKAKDLGNSIENQVKDVNNRMDVIEDNQNKATMNQRKENEQMQQTITAQNAEIIELKNMLKKYELTLRTYVSPYELLTLYPDAPSGVYRFSVNNIRFESYVHMQSDKAWVMLSNSVANEEGTSAVGNKNTRAFWRIGYAKRFSTKGEASIDENYYNGLLYQVGKAEYMDEVQDLGGNVHLIFSASANGIDTKTMKMLEPKFHDGIQGAYNSQFAGGWACYDRDFDDSPTTNCSTSYSTTSQHYTACWNYNLGADADAPINDADWGPHVHASIFSSLDFGGDTSSYRRVSRITRWIYWK